MGISQALRPHGVFVQGHEPAGSAAMTGGTSGPFAMQGWTGFVVPQWDAEKVDEVDAIGDDEAIAMMRRLARRGRHLRGHLDRRQRRRRAPPRGAARPGRGDRDARRRHGVQVPDREPVRGPLGGAPPSGGSAKTVGRARHAQHEKASSSPPRARPPCLDPRDRAHKPRGAEPRMAMARPRLELGTPRFSGSEAFG